MRANRRLDRVVWALGAVWLLALAASCLATAALVDLRHVKSHLVIPEARGANDEADAAMREWLKELREERRPRHPATILY